MRQLRVGLIGLGIMGRNHARILSNLSGVDFVGVADLLPISGSLENLKIKSSFDDYNNLLLLDLDYCVIAAPTGFHKEIAIAALEKGVHCLIEKPVAPNYVDAKQIQDVAKKYNLIVGVGHVERFNSAIMQLKSRLLADELGTLYQISFVRQGPFPGRIADVGVVKDLATHDIDLAMWLSDSKFANVYSQLAYKTGRIHEDLASINGRMENDVIVNMLINWISPNKERKLVVSGEKGTFWVDTLRSELTFFENAKYLMSQESFRHFNGVAQGNITTFAFEKPEPLLVEHEQFRDRILGRTSDIVTLSEGIETVRIADAVLQSSLELRSINL